MNFLHYYATGWDSFSGLEGKVLNAFSSFSKLCNIDVLQFHFEYSDSLNKLLNSLAEKIHIKLNRRTVIKSGLQIV